MSRLTYKSESGMTWFVDEKDRRLEPCEMSPHHNRLAIEKLANYEDLEEAGRLIELPCKVGERVWVADGVYEPWQTIYTCIHQIVADMECGWAIGHTEAEAEAKLAELKGEYI